MLLFLSCEFLEYQYYSCLFCGSKWNPGPSFLFLTLLIHVLILFCSCNIISSTVLARWHHFGAPSSMFLFHAVKCNLTELTTKSVCVPLRVCRIVRHIHRCIHLWLSIHSCPALFCEIYLHQLVHLSGVSIPLHLFCLCTCASACFELLLVDLCSKQSLLLSTCTYISVTGALLPFWVGAHGFVSRICQPWEQSHLGAGCQ